MRRLQRQEEVHLREEQDREYRQTLEEDQRRQREKLEEQERKEEEEKKSKEEEEQAMNEKMNRLDNARDVLNRNGEGEPDPGDKSIATARVRLMLPSGKRVERRFRGNDTIDTMRAFLVLHFDGNGVDIENFQLNSNYPKKALVDGERTLENEGLCPQAVIMVQDLDA
jgi:FAS-associated factor 2